jgi:sialidase-1
MRFLAQPVLLALLTLTPVRPDFAPIFSPLDGGYACFRIPALVASPHSPHTLVAFAEGRRYSCSDHGYVDLVSRTSHDGGATWGALFLVHSESSASANVTIGNPAPVASATTPGLLLLPFSRENRAAAVLRSVDFGASWTLGATLPVLPAWSWVATGPPGSLELPSGRLVVPFDFSGPSQPFAAAAFLSDDGGGTWRASAGMLPGGNEAQAALLPWAASKGAGTLHLSARASHGTSRLAAQSTDGGNTWSAPWPTVAEGMCEGSVVALPSSRRLVMSSAYNAAHRQNMTLHASTDDGRTWVPRVTVDAGPAAYSALLDLSTPAGDAVGLLYESGPLYGHLSFGVVEVPA